MSGGNGSRKRRETRRFGEVRDLLRAAGREMQSMIDYIDTTWEEGALDEVDPCPDARKIVQRIEAFK